MNKSKKKEVYKVQCEEKKPEVWQKRKNQRRAK